MAAVDVTLLPPGTVQIDKVEPEQLSGVVTQAAASRGSGPGLITYSTPLGFVGAGSGPVLMS
jgi:hypothetical protein